MHFVRSLSLLALAACILASCTKETSYEPDLPVAPGNGGGGNGGGGNNNTDIEGIYDLAGVIVYTEAHSVLTAAGQISRSSTITNYSGTSQSGVAEFKAGKLTTKDFEFTAKGIAKNNTDGIQTEIPLELSSPATNASATYTKIGNDSLHCPGIIEMPSMGGGTTPVASATEGYKYSWSGDTLILRAAVHMVENQNISGMTVNIRSYVSLVTKLKKRK